MVKTTKLSPAQNMAANPQDNIWVQANAGTGKTSVLTQRLLRILFRTRDPKTSGILCLTYTNAGAGEMRNRILAELKQWALSSDTELKELLEGIPFNTQITDSDIAHARDIFFLYIDNPDMLKIKTIHGFCEEILHRFPIEANISPAWKLISDANQRVLLWDAFNNMVMNPTNSETESAFAHIVNRVSEYAMDNLLNILTEHYKDFFQVDNFINYRNYFIDSTKNFLQINNPVSSDIPIQQLQQIIFLATDKQKSQKKPAQYLETIIKNTKDYIENTIDFEKYKQTYLTQTGTKIANIAKNDFLVTEQERVFAINEYNSNKKTFDDTLALFDLSAAFAQSYIQIKQQHNVLDFEDLILYTRKLFSDPKTMGWVLSQMDVSLSHILVDEAQDTSPEQWDIIRMLTGDFFNNGDTDDLPRSIFVVGDTKQSIYGFQGADPTAFIKSRDDIANQITTNYRTIKEIPLDQNFRSSPSVLYSVDTFFQDPHVQSISSFVNQKHKCSTKNPGNGLVELHKLDAKQITEHTIQDFAKNITAKIKNILADDKYQPKDIMILVQNRHPFVLPLVNELKKANIDVAGSDRIVLPKFPAIRDLLNLTRFCLDLTDDYSLCCTLKSPLYRFSEQDIYNLCTQTNKLNKANKRTDPTIPTIPVYNILQSIDPATHQDLQQLIYQANKLSPYSFFSTVLRHNNNRQKMIAALGDQIIDPLEEFMTICLSYERTQSGTLREFLKWFITGGSEVKRDMDAASGVRIVTVHGSKGLEAPIVFLIDTARTPDSDNILPLPITNTSTYKTPWIWYGPNTTKTEAIKTISEAHKKQQLAEYYRLLYVAMTRAQQELYIYGYTQHRNPNELSWHTNLWRVFSEIHQSSNTQEYIRIEHERSAE